MTSPILYCNPSSTVFLIDIPSSIELGQLASRKLLSSAPLQHPYPSIEPRSPKALAKFGDVSLLDLVLRKHLEIALGDLKEAYNRPFCLPRAVAAFDEEEHKRDVVKVRTKDKSETKRKRKRGGGATKVGQVLTPPNLQPNSNQVERFIYSNPHKHTTNLSHSEKRYNIPPHSTCILGSIPASIPLLLSSSLVKFNLILLDPPWPNRSAVRSKAYSTPNYIPSTGTSHSLHQSHHGLLGIHSLLSAIPMSALLATDGYIAIWVTNKATFRKMILGEGSLFQEWGVELVEEWIWLKVTEQGEPVTIIDGVWRQPWEVCLIGKKVGLDEERLREEFERVDSRREDMDKEGVKRRVIVGVPDLHSRKPCLKGLFEDVLGLGNGAKYEALEIFARTFTAGWWSWGDECLKFQEKGHWVDVDNTVAES